MRTIAGFLFALMLLAGCSQASIPDTSTSTARATETAAAASITAEPTQEPTYKLNISDIPAYTGQPYVELNGNEPYFDTSDLTTEPFENMTADYVRETNNHVLYRVTPIFEGNNLLATGVQMEALSVEDNGDGIKFNVFCYNVQPGVVIDYATGDNRSDGNVAVKAEPTEETSANNKTAATTYILNTNTKKFHILSCSSVKKMKDKNKREFTGSREEAIAQGYSPCQRCIGCGRIKSRFLQL